MTIQFGDRIKSLTAKKKELQGQYDKMGPDFVQQVKFNNANTMFYLNITEATIYQNLSSVISFPEDFLNLLYNTKFEGAEKYLQEMEDSLKN